jgi:lipopolysaccharide export system protein LptA
MSRSGLSAVRAIRLLLLVLLLGGVAAVSALYVLGRIGRQDPARMLEEAAREPALGDRGSESYAVEGGSIRYTATVGDQVLFEIQGDTYRAGQDGAVLLERVAIEMAREEGSYRLQGDRATYDPNSNDARLEGAVLVEGPDQLVLRTDWLELRESGKLVVASRGSEFELGARFVGTAGNLRLDLEQDQVLLDGRVRLATREGAPSPLLLVARAISYDRRGRKVLARGNVRLIRPDGRLEALRLNLDLDADTDDVRVVRASGQVKGWWEMAEARDDAPAASPAEVGDAESGESEGAPLPAAQPGLSEASPPAVRRYDLYGMKIVILLARESRQPERLDIQGFRRSPAILESVDGQAARRRLSAADLAAGFDQGLVSWATAEGGVQLVELDAAGAEVRRASANRAEALFDDLGTLVRIELDLDVEIHETGVTAHAEHATVDDRQGRTSLRSATWVEVTNEQGTILAPTVTYAHEGGLLTAEGGVRAAMRSGEGSALGPLGEGGSDQPVRVEADEAVLRQGDGDFVFTGSARAWQEQTRITADQIRGNQKAETLAASGAVETHWRSGAPAADAGGEETEPVDITAQHFDYSGSAGTAADLVYEGSVVVRQAGRRLSCEHLTVTLDDDRQAERMDCRESAVLEDPALQRQVRGVAALYFPKLGEVVVSPPLKLIEPNRVIESPQRLWYRLEDGHFELGPGAPDPERSG